MESIARLGMLFVERRCAALVFSGKTRCSGDSFAKGGLLLSQLDGELHKPLPAPPFQVCVPAWRVTMEVSRAAKPRPNRDNFFKFIEFKLCCERAFYALM